jgi:hypothetical protein
MYDTGTHLSVVHHQLQERDEFLLQIREHLEQAQHQYKEQYDHKHQELQFTPGEMGLSSPPTPANGFSRHQGQGQTRAKILWPVQDTRACGRCGVQARAIGRRQTSQRVPCQAAQAVPWRATFIVGSAASSSPWPRLPGASGSHQELGGPKQTRSIGLVEEHGRG